MASKRQEPAPEELYMIIDLETQEALRGEAEGERPEDEGPLFFTSREALERFAREEGIEPYRIHAVPGGILTRMNKHVHWVDGRRRGG
jgi:hypothetical protein